jgi:hypothetical protein
MGRTKNDQEDKPNPYAPSTPADGSPQSGTRQDTGIPVEEDGPATNAPVAPDAGSTVDDSDEE